MRVRTSQFLLASTLALAAGALTNAQAPAPTRSSSNLTIDRLVHIKHPSGHQWTPDGSHVWWTYDDGGVNNVWAAPADGSGKPVALTNYEDGQSGIGGFWSPDGQTFFYQRGGGLLAVPVTGGEPHAAWPSAEHGAAFTLSPDGTRVAFLARQSGGGAQLIVHECRSTDSASAGQRRFGKLVARQQAARVRQFDRRRRSRRTGWTRRQGGQSGHESRSGAGRT